MYLHWLSHIIGFYQNVLGTTPAQRIIVLWLTWPPLTLREVTSIKCIFVNNAGFYCRRVLYRKLWWYLVSIVLYLGCKRCWCAFVACASSPWLTTMLIRMPRGLDLRNLQGDLTCTHWGSYSRFCFEISHACLAFQLLCLLARFPGIEADMLGSDFSPTWNRCVTLPIGYAINIVTCH